jgi:hypothetical protein
MYLVSPGVTPTPPQKLLFLWEEKHVAPLIATPYVDKCNRRQTRKAKELGIMLRT